MDILLIVASLAGLGLYMNNDKQKTPRIEIQKNTLRNTSRILDERTYHPYEQDEYTTVRRDEQASADALYAKSKTPEETGIIPPLYNTVDDSKKKQLSSDSAEDPAPEAVVVAGVKFSDVNENYDYIHANADFKHINQVPFFSGSQPKQNMTDGAYTSRLERFTGQVTGDDAGMYSHKKEVPSFATSDNKNPMVFGAPGNTEEVIQRYRDTTTNTKQGQALNPLQYVSQNTRGIREEAKTVDQLRSNAPDRDKLVAEVEEVYGRGNVISRGTSIPTFQQNHTARESINNFRVAVPHSTARQSLYSNTEIVVPPNARSITAKKGDSYFGAAMDTIANYITKDVYRTIVSGRSQIEENTYAGPTNARDKNQQTYNMTPERTTLKQTTQTDYTPQISISTGGAYKLLPQDAQATIRQQTTQEYSAPAGSGISANTMDRENIYAAEINALRSISNVEYTPAGGSETTYKDIGDTRTNSLRGISDTQEFITREDGAKAHLVARNVHKKSRGKDVSVIDRMNIGSFIENQQAKNPLSRSNTKNVDIL